MSDSPHDLTHDILKQLQAGFADMRERQERMEIMLQDIVPRVVRIEEIVRKQRRNSAGMLVMMQATASDFNERVSLVEERLDALEAHPA